MSALTLLLKKEGDEVFGSDEKRENEELAKNGIKIFPMGNFAKIKESDVVVFSSAIGEDNIDLKFSKSLGKKVVSRGELLGEISKNYQNVIAVAGSHGKTTTTALIYNILKTAGKNPTLHLGGILKEEKSNLVVGGKEFFVTEACEYHDNFLFLRPKIAVITNIEKEHLDYFKTFARQLKSFEKFKRQSDFVFEKNEEFYAENIYYENQKLSFSLFKKNLNSFKISKINKKTLKNAQKCVKNSIFKCFLDKKYKLFQNSKFYSYFEVNICEEINIENIIMAIRVSEFLGIDKEVIVKGIENFQGVKLRFEKVKSKYFQDVVLDYAHHPTEIKNTILTAQKVFPKRDICYIFQPHTYSRTKTLLPEFIEVFKDLDNLILYRTYDAREKEKDGVSAKKLSTLIKKADYCDNLTELFAILKTLKKESVLIFIGAGDLSEKLRKEKFIFS